MQQGNEESQRWSGLGAIAAVVIGLAATAHGVFSPRILAFYANSPDSVDITNWADRARLEDILGWWAGPWIQRTSPYYRPLSSLVFWLEYKAFGWNFQGHVIISWLLHGAVCLLLYRAGLAWLQGDGRARVALAVAAVALFNARIGPTGPGWLLAPITYGVVAWWPGQTDQFCLLTSLGALLCFDAWLASHRRQKLVQALVLWAVALLFKEMAVCLPLAAGFLVLYRKGSSAARLWGTGDAKELTLARRLGIGLFWQVLLAGLVIVAAYLAVRSALVPGAWGPKARPLVYFLEKIVWFSAERPAGYLVTRWPWLLAVCGFLSVCIYVYVRLPRRPSIAWLLLVAVLGAGAIAHLLGENFALITVPREIAAIVTVTIFLLGLAVLAHARGGPTWPLLGMVIAIHLPILHVLGPHYMYWPAAFWGLFNASLIGVVVELKTAGRLRWNFRQPPTRLAESP